MAVNQDLAARIVSQSGSHDFSGNILAIQGKDTMQENIIENI